MKCLVTGGAGFIGSNLVDRLVADGHQVVVIDNQSSSARDVFHWVYTEGVENYRYDICDYEKTRPLYEGVDYVFHLAAEAHIQPAIENPIRAVMVNAVGTCTVLQCAREAGVKKVMYSSTASAYGGNQSPNIETQLDDCLNPYSVSKVSGEKICKMYTDLFGLRTVIFRYFNVYGERQPLRGQYAPVVGLFLEMAKKDEPLTIVGDGNQRRDFVYVGDVVNANITAALTDVDYDAYGQVYNVGTGNNYSVNQIARMISSNKVNVAPRAGEVRYSLANSNKFKTTFGWKPTVKLEDWIAQNA